MQWNKNWLANHYLLNFFNITKIQSSNHLQYFVPDGFLHNIKFCHLNHNDKIRVWIISGGRTNKHSKYPELFAFCCIFTMKIYHTSSNSCSGKNIIIQILCNTYSKTLWVASQYDLIFYMHIKTTGYALYKTTEYALYTVIHYKMMFTYLKLCRATWSR